MSDPKHQVQYPELDGSEQHHDLKDGSKKETKTNRGNDADQADTADVEKDDK